MSMKSELKEQIKEDLIRHEGYVAEIYLCSENYPTFGIGHLITTADPEYTWPVGTPVEPERIDNAFELDFDVAYSDACALFLNLSSHPDEVVRVCVNMAFNLGRTRLSQFKNMIGAVNEGKYNQAAEEMIDSRWYHQVGRRSKELVELMRKANG